MSKNVPITHGPHGPWAPLPMCPIGHVTYWPCGPYPLYPIPPVPLLPMWPIPLYPIPLWASLPICPIPPHQIPPVPLCPCGPHCPCAPYPLYPIAPCVHMILIWYWRQFWCHKWWSLKTLKMFIESIFGQFWWPSYLTSKLMSICVNLIMSIYFFCEPPP